MTPEQAQRVERMMRALGIAGVVAPVDPANPTGEWLVFSEADPTTRSDITADVLAAVAERNQEPAPEAEHQGPMRGFVGLPPMD